MKPSEYIKLYSEYEDFNSLSNLFDAYRRQADEWRAVIAAFDRLKLKDDAIEEMRAEIEKEIPLAEKTIDRWRSKFHKKYAREQRKAGKKQA